jgi:signal transduction histidine kinase
MAGLVTAALLAALASARRRARRLAAPLETLATASRAVGDGDFSARVPPCGIEEIDRVADTQNATVGRLGDLLERERQFTANASHQLRTPLAGLQLVLEAACVDPARDPHAALEEALSTTRRLQATVEDVLALHLDSSVRGPGSEPSRSGTHSAGEDPRPLAQLLEDVAARWHGPLAASGRWLGHTCDTEVADLPLPSIRVGQILDVLLDNALHHGSGMVRISARSAGTAIGIDVSDEGPGVPETAGDVFTRGSGAGHGIGLSLARDFAASLGGRLVLSTRTPPVFTLLLPTAP